MKKLLTLAVILMFAASAQAQTAQELLNAKVSSQPNTIGFTKVDNYKADGIASYKGRNNNRAEESRSAQVKTGNNVSRSVSIETGKNNGAQLENLESTAGELVQKVDDDRLRRSKRYEDSFELSKDTLQDAYDITSGVDVTKLGSEQDPSLQNAFKCSNIESCNKDHSKAKLGTDNHDIQQSCTTDQRLHWNGSAWSCIGIFEKPSSSSCLSHQYSKVVNGGVACVDYIYEWILGEYTSCQPDNTKTATVECFSKKDVNDKNPVKTKESNCLGRKPEDAVVSCTYVSYANYTYTCPDGYTLSGSTCTKEVSVYAPGELVRVQTSSTYACNDNPQPFKSYTSNGCVYYWKCPTGYTQNNDVKQCEKKTTQTISATKTCPSGYTYNSSSDKCKK